ncbi:MAG: ATP-binding protein, partial [Acidimicrobiales bacterium]|nr:ATP-binding protein [Acidimicrobiales bacterium]
MLVGRDRELRAVADLIVGRRPVVLTGPAGIGKSTLAVVAAARSGSGEAPRTTGALASRQAASMFAFERLLRRRLPSPEAAARAVLRAGDVPLVVDDLQWA